MNPELLFIPSCKKRWVLHLIFVRIPKNASTSIYDHLGTYNLVNKYQDSFLKNLKTPLYKNFFDPTHAKPNEIKSILPANPNNYFSFAVVRNPWDRFVSMYSFSIKHQLWKIFGLEKEPSFEEFCKICEIKKEENDAYFFPIQNQSEWTAGAFEVNKILKFENLKEEFSSMIEEIGAVHISKNLPHKNSSDHNHYKSYYNESSKTLVSQLYKQDIENFKYTF
jgi:hypothetical protein